jgi:hypothetical protein
MNIVALPFCAALLAEHIDAPNERQAALIIYTATVAAGGIIYNALWRHAPYRHRLLAPEVETRVVRRLSRRYLAGPVSMRLRLVSPF